MVTRYLDMNHLLMNVMKFHDFSSTNYMNPGYFTLVATDLKP